VRRLGNKRASVTGVVGGIACPRPQRILQRFVQISSSQGRKSATSTRGWVCAKSPRTARLLGAGSAASRSPTLVTGNLDNRDNPPRAPTHALGAPS
jgi:hypothetical protein